MTNDKAQEIYENWVSLRRSVGRKASAFTPKRKKHIADLLNDFYADNIILVVQYLKTADDNYARFMRGKNENNRDYTGFDNVFRQQKMSAKIDKAIQWEKASKNNETYNEEGMFFPFRILEA